MTKHKTKLYLKKKKAEHKKTSIIHYFGKRCKENVKQT